mgnify:CR=1 FL=1
MPVGTRSTSKAHRRPTPLPSLRTRPVTPTLDWSVTWRLRSRAPSAASTCRRCRTGGRRAVRSGDRPCRAGTPASVADWFGAEPRPPRRAPGTCRQCGGPATRRPDRRAAGVRIPDDRATPAGSRSPTAPTGPPAASAALAMHRGRHRPSCAHRTSTNAEQSDDRQHLLGEHRGRRFAGTNDRRAHSARSDVDDEDAHGAGRRHPAGSASCRKRPPMMPPISAPRLIEQQRARQHPRPEHVLVGRDVPDHADALYEDERDDRG